ncbi:MAG: universal stress protein [Clostridiaceae bacterium]
MSNNFKRMSPEEALRKATKEKKGKLKIFLGYAPGVGKTFAMLNEANRRLKRGQDIVIGYLEPHDRPETIDQSKNIPVVPRKIIEYNGTLFEELDTEAVIKRKPNIVLVDELAHTNAPTSLYEKRYEDVQILLDNGINVITTLNIQHLESLNDVVFQITGIKVRETIPDSIVYNADDVVVVDITPDALRGRLERGIIYKQETAEKALKNFFRKGNLTALREIALRQTAEEVDEDLELYMKEQGIKENWYTVERIMVCISANPNAIKLIRRGARAARRYKCEMYVVDVACTHPISPKLTDKDIKTLERHRKIAKKLNAETITLKGDSISEELLKFAQEKHITQLFIGHSKRGRLQTFLRGDTVSKILKEAKNIEVRVIPWDNV